MKGNITQRHLKRGTSYESYVEFQGDWVYLGRFASETEAKQAQAKALPLLQRGERPIPPPVPKSQIGTEGISTRTLKDGTVLFDINVTAMGKREMVTSFRTEAEALQARTLWLEHINRSDLTFRPVTTLLPKQRPIGADLKMDPPPPFDILFAEYAYRWFLARRDLWATSTLYDYRCGVKRCLNDALGTVPVKSINESHLAALDAMMVERKMSKKRRTKIRRILAKILHSTIVDGLRKSHPASYAWCHNGMEE
jgi:hypothetical protein